MIPKESDSSSDDLSSDYCSSVTSASNNNLTADIFQEPPKAGGVVVETFLFVGVLYMIFFELILVAYLNFSSLYVCMYVLISGEVLLPHYGSIETTG